MRNLLLKDGRNLSYQIYGDPNGSPVIFSHGFSDSCLIKQPDDALTASLGVNIIAADQPGVGESSPKPGRTMVEWGSDMEELANALRLDRFSVAGHSGGAPHALAIAHRLPDRVDKVVLASPVGPLDDPAMVKLLRLKDLKILVLLKRWPWLLRWSIKLQAKQAMGNVVKYAENLTRADASDASTILGDPDQKNMFVDNFTRGLAQNGEGLIEMTMALWNWGFAMSDITQHVDVFYGDADYILDPKMCALVTKRLANSSGHVWPGAGHYGFIDRERWTGFVSAMR